MTTRTLRARAAWLAVRWLAPAWLAVRWLAPAWLAVAIAPVAGCSSSTPTVPQGPHPDDSAGVPVPYPPPPAKVEVIPLRRRQTCVWRDGAWDFRGGQWEWMKGGWVAEQEACYFAPGETRFESTPAGVALVFRRGTWFDKASGKPCEAPPSCAQESTEVSMVRARAQDDLAPRSEPW